MLRNKALSCLVVLSALVSTACAAGDQTPAPSFTISASNVTMPSSGEVSIPFTLTSVNGFVGSVGILCSEPTVAGSKHEGPYCENYGAVQSYSLIANGTATGGYKIVAIKPPLVPAAAFLRHGGGATWALAGVLMLGLGLRKRSRRLARGLLAVGVIGLAGLGISGCSGPPTLRPGDYVFTLNATSVSTPTGPSIEQNATATVTVPAGIVTDSSNGN